MEHTLQPLPEDYHTNLSKPLSGEGTSIAIPSGASFTTSEAHQWTLRDTRNTRNTLLAQCDWTQASDCPLSSDKKAEWAEYRQALRDITSSGEPVEPRAFPNPPSA